MQIQSTHVQKIQNELELKIDDYPGGIAIWGALPALIDTSHQSFDRGVHVHARRRDGQKKVIDQTYGVVHCYYQNHYFTITELDAVAFTMASIFNIKLLALQCEWCKSDIIAHGLNSVIPSHQHGCQNCGHTNYTIDYCIANPLVKLKFLLNDLAIQREVLIPNRVINLDLRWFEEGFQIWGSNPAIIWTSPKPEESALHVHGFEQGNKRVVDNTYGEVILHGESLNIQMIRVLQIQMNLKLIYSQLDTIHCPRCNEPIFDTALKAVIPSTEKFCTQCEYKFATHKCISNPYYYLLEAFNEAYS
ncbi:hypothetical protein Lsan_3411 [Legionella santicrucis]|uniref:Uncharacterized protein n=1 Tax=Legionella santicrucis TaxID=45074 RepID=A0A0W0YH73_9GAMM|nr:hypothetical protein [Legionella santicrucis]KTD55859.1 hypothetical protein Lsan_3411 [Legionella santicrucis]